MLLIFSYYPKDFLQRTEWEFQFVILYPKRDFLLYHHCPHQLKVVVVSARQRFLFLQFLAVIE
jgi:hypothetical protein